jgi:beta-xylosidase
MHLLRASLLTLSALIAAACGPADLADDALDFQDEEEEVASSEDDLSFFRRKTFTNPVFPSSCPDPGVLKDGSSFYMVCTGGSFRIRKSKDLVEWSDTGKSILSNGKAPWASDGKRNWAPEIHRVGRENYVAYYTASDARGKLAIGLAYAKNPEGPYTDLGRPLVQHDIGAIDATYFADDDGKKYLYWKVDGNQNPGGRTPILGRELSSDGRSFKPGSVAREVFNNDSRTWEKGLVEAPWIVKRDGRYYMFYAADVYDARYKSGVARASSPLGTFTRKGPAILTNNDTWVGPGHGSVISHRGKDWFVHHARPTDGRGNAIKEKGRYVVLSRVEWKDGWPFIAGGTTPVGPQRAP